MTTNNQRVFRIPEGNFPRFNSDIERLVKRAEKIGVPAPSFTFSILDEPDGDGFVTRVYLVNVTGQAPKYDGWSFVAAIDIDRENPGSPNVVNVLPGYDKDPEWTTMGERCDHCNVGRRGRKKLVVVQHDNGERKIVGSTCLHDFLGHASPQAIAAWAEMLASFLDEDPDRFGGPGAGTEIRLDPASYLSWVLKSIREDGWVSRKEARENTTVATADMALNDIHAFAAGARTIEAPTMSDHTEAEEIVTWGHDIELGVNDYLDNLAAVAQKSGWRFRDLGLGASMVVAFRNERRKKIEPATPAAKSEFVGVKGEKIKIENATVTKVQEMGNLYGEETRYLIKVIDGVGNCFAWWTTTATPPKEGMRIEGTAKVKEHKEFGGIAETTINYFVWKELQTT